MLKELDYNDFETIERINAFLTVNPYAEYNETIKWNRVRTEDKKYYLYYEDNKSDIKWVCSLLEKGFGEYVYAPRGPVLNFGVKEEVTLFIKEIKIWLKSHNYKKIVINPCIKKELLSNFPSNITILPRNDYANLHDSCKLAIMDIIFNEESMLSMLPSKFRQNTRRSTRKGLTSKISESVDFNNFYKLYLETASRHDFKPHNLDYFKNIIKEFKDSFIFIEVWYQNVPLAMSIDIIYKDKLIYLYGVSSSTNRELLGMYNLQWEAIKYCIRNKIKYYDFGGVFCEENDYENKDYGLYQFKKGYCYKGFIDIVPDIIIESEDKND